MENHHPLSHSMLLLSLVHLDQQLRTQRDNVLINLISPGQPSLQAFCYLGQVHYSSTREQRPCIALPCVYEFYLWILSSVATARQEKLAWGSERRSETFLVWMAFRWTTPEPCLWCLYREVFLTFFCFSATIKSLRGSSILYSARREPLKPLGEKKLHGVSLEAKEEAGKRVKRVQEKRVERYTFLCHYTRLISNVN